ncbi:MAG: DUF3280 domain-containing protein [Burkholderiales bacterium]
MRFLVLAAVLFAAAANAAQRIVVLDFELLDELKQPGSEADDARRLAAAGKRLRAGLAECAPVEMVAADPAAEPVRRLRSQIAYLHRCNGCATDIGTAAGAQLVLFPWVQKVSNLILNVNAEVRSAAGDAVVAVRSVDMRGNTDRSWERAVAALARRLCESFSARAGN